MATGSRTGTGSNVAIPENLKTFTLSECVICMSVPPDQVFLPCGHVCACSDCYTGMLQAHRSNPYHCKANCPLCRQTITGVVKYDAVLSAQSPAPTHTVATVTTTSSSNAVINQAEPIIPERPTKRALVAELAATDEVEESTTNNKSKRQKKTNLKNEGNTSNSVSVPVAVVPDTSSSVSVPPEAKTRGRPARKTSTPIVPIVSVAPVMVNKKTRGKKAADVVAVSDTSSLLKTMIQDQKNNGISFELFKDMIYQVYEQV